MWTCQVVQKVIGLSSMGKKIQDLEANHNVQFLQVTMYNVNYDFPLNLVFSVCVFRYRCGFGFAKKMEPEFIPT